MSGHLRLVRCDHCGESVPTGVEVRAKHWRAADAVMREVPEAWRGGTEAALERRREAIARAIAEVCP